MTDFDRVFLAVPVVLWGAFPEAGVLGVAAGLLMAACWVWGARAWRRAGWP